MTQTGNQIYAYIIYYSYVIQVKQPSLNNLGTVRNDTKKHNLSDLADINSDIMQPPYKKTLQEIVYFNIDILHI